ncbi:MAG: carboxypeptidase regulatory-like domain-containing protein [candidate division KSB1 bacterium]|nr:carboxypeptidase regulatory-like domain-containing protein [candidate division KSB1 bacterium]
MKRQKLALVWLILSCLVNLPVEGGVTGKIRGLVRDAKTKDPLPGANVVINKVWLNNEARDYPATLGAASNLQGEFVILKVPPGNYSVTASMIGYSPLTHQHVKVSVDRTTVVDFLLQETVLELGQELVVEASRDLIQLDVSATETYVTAKEYQNTPFANRVEDVIGLQSGISGNLIEGDIKIREGEPMEVGFLLDGMAMVDRKFNRPVMSVQAGTVEEIKIMRNGFNAEYGQSRSGVINVITKNPTDQFHFSLDYQFTPAQKPHYGRNKYDPTRRWEWRLLAGPRAFEGDSLVVPDGLYETKYTWIGWNKYAENLLNDNNPNNDLTAEEAFELWKWRHRPLAYGNKPGHTLDLSLSGRVPLLPWQANFLLGGKYEYRPFDYPQSRDHYDEKISSLKLVHTISPNIKLTLNNVYSEVKTVTQGDSRSLWSQEDRIWYDGAELRGEYLYYPFYRPVINRYSTIAGAKWVHTISPRLFYEVNLNHFYVKWKVGRPDSARAEDGRYFHGRLYYDPQSGWIPKERGADDDASGYRMYGGALTWDDSWNRRTAFSAFITYQFHPAHELKAGFECNYDILREHRLHWHDEDSTQAFTHEYRVEPFELAAFVQDKIEFQGMVANIGLRFDYFNTNSARPDPHRALEYTNTTLYEAYITGTYPTVRAKPKHYLSPRLGISHPLSSRSKLYFNYGHFVQTPKNEVLYHLLVAHIHPPRIIFMGNPNITFPKTIAYELGCDIGLNDFWQLHVGAFYKDYSDFESAMVYARSDQSLLLEWYAQNDYKEIRGIEIELRKTSGRFFTGWLNYNYIKKSEANLEIPYLSDIPIITDDPNIGINGVLRGVPRSDIVLIQPNARGVITFSAPSNWGPKLKGYSLLGDTNLSLQVFYQAGPYRQHPRKSFRDAHPDVRFKELDRCWANMRLSRLVQLKSLHLELYLDVSNILHTKFRYPPSGRSGEDYYDDLWTSGRLNQVGTDQLTNPRILRTEDDDVYWARVKTIIFGLRVNI